MIIPPYLKRGSTIAIVATARTADEQHVRLSKKILEEQGFNVVTAPNLSSTYHRFAGDDSERLRCFQAFLDDETIDAIWLARGGYGTGRMLDELDWSKFLSHPKWLIGFSDFTMVHLKLQHLKVASIHGCNFTQLANFGIASENSISLLEILLNQSRSYTFPGSSDNREGTAEGILTGGNLSLITNTLGTPLQLNTNHRILLLEDCNEYLYHYDRMLHQLKQAGLLANLEALIIGESTVKTEPDDIDFGFSIEQMVLMVCAEYKYPICFHAPFGHTAQNYALALNTKYSLQIAKNEVIISPY
ncbi:MAG: LD-carboxypeptidase [Bacteroidetes bacterium]|nr:LD-carboxypeptidase [Bacteroidota bacterium]